MYQIFISYRREGGYATARLLYEHLKAIGLNPFFDFEELRSGPFNERLYKTIEEADNFVLVLPPDSLDRCCDEKDWLRLEIEHAIQHNKNIIPCMMSGFSWPTNLPESLTNLPLYNGVFISREYFDASISKLLTMLKNVEIENGHAKETVKCTERIENKYFTLDDKKEVKRLKIQQELMRKFDSEEYEKLVKDKTGLSVLDLGSNNGDYVYDRIISKTNDCKLVGLEYDSKAVAVANEKYGKPNQIEFFEVNVESEEVIGVLESAMQKLDIDGFDLVNVSMLILHLKSPYHLLKIVRKYMKKDGVMIIKDIDDGFNVAYPDEKGDFKRIVDICNGNETAGYRHSGRQIFTLLKRLGYKDIELLKNGLSTVGMDYDEKEAFFDVYFSFILEDLLIMREKYPNDKRIEQDYQWYKDNYESFEEKFHEESFFFNLGFMLFTAKK